MRTKIMVILSILVLAVLNYSVYEKEQVKKNGEVVLLELAPVDPRSLMQGDYMQLRYKIEREVPVKQLASHQKRGDMVISVDENKVGKFVRFYGGENLKSNEKLLHFHKKYNSVRIVPDSFFFQEGHREYYQGAKYGVFMFDSSNNKILTALADKDRNTIVVSQTK